MDFPALEFFVASASTGEVYAIKLSRSGDNLTCTCTCQAGQNGTHCKHRLGILSGDPSDVQAEGKNQLPLVAAMLSGTDVEEALARVAELEKKKAEVDKLLKAAKKGLARSLDD